MSAGEKILIFMGSKWFAAFWAVVLGITLPFTYNNAKVVWFGKEALAAAGSSTLTWLLVAVFACNILGFGFALWKFFSMNSVPKPDTPTQGEW